VIAPTHLTAEEQNRETISKPAKRPKRAEAEITQSIQSWSTKIQSSRQSLLSVQLSQKGEPSLAYTYLTRELGADGTVLKSRMAIFDSILQKMIEEEIVIPGHSSIANEWRRKLLCWYEALSEDEKKSIPVFGNTISAKASLFKVDGIKNLKWARAKLPLVEQTFNEILSNLTKLGVIDANYKNCEERKFDAEKKKMLSTPKISPAKALIKLRLVPLSTYDDLVENHPTQPFNKLLHMFAAASMKSKSSSGQNKLSEGFRYVTQHLVEVGFSGDEDPRAYVSPNYLVRFRKFLVDQLDARIITTSTANGVLSAVRAMYKRAVKIKGLGLTTFIDVQGFAAVRQTDEYRPYPPSVRKLIQQACDRERQETNELAKDYVPFQGGCDPLDDNGDLKRGFVTLENARWIFENKLNCRVISKWSANPANKYEQGIVRIFHYLNLGVSEAYASWGVIYQVTSRLIAPYITRLAQVTGLNADSLKGLDIDDFVERHELSQRPYLRYWKERSGGEKLLHLDLMHADCTWLTLAQSVEVKKIFDEVKYLTRHIRERAEGSVKNKLFIYESQKRNEFRKVKSFENSIVINLVMNQFAKDHNLKTEDGLDLNLSASRLRPSLVAELIDKGVSIREIQVILGHKSISTTCNYLDQLEFSKTARAVVDAALTKIHKETVAQEKAKDKKPETNTASVTNNSAIIIKTGLAECRDALNPPDEIKKLPNYKNGNACSLLNKCLSCRNAIITAAHLPELFAMQREYRSLIATSTVAETPYGTIIRENLETLDSILTLSPQGFSAEQLEEARRLSEHIITSSMIESVTL
jgi:hypothetical protein